MPLLSIQKSKRRPIVHLKKSILPQKSFLLFMCYLFVGQLSPTDADSGDNGVVTCAKASSSGVAETYYSVTGNGDILLSKALYENGAEPLSRGSSAQ